jgi:hypothetical protein
MARHSGPPNQLMELFLHVAEQLGCRTDRDLAGLAEVGVDSIPLWRGGAVKEFKPRTLAAIKAGLAARVRALRQHHDRARAAVESGIVPMEVEVASGPSALQREFTDRMVYDYLGHRFLYFDPQGALAWENLIREGYGQEVWLKGVEDCCRSALDWKKGGDGRAKGALARALGLGGKSGVVGLDVVGLGPGDGSKEVVALREVLAAERGLDQPLPWLTFTLVDVSIPLLLAASLAAHAATVEAGREEVVILPVVADFEEGGLGFIKRLPTALDEARGRRLVLLLGNVLGNVRHEEHFLRQKVAQIVRPGDLLLVEVGARMARLEDDPVYAMTLPQPEPTAVYTNRLCLLEGPYRRWEASIGRPPSKIETRIWVRQDDDTCPVPGSINFCHDLLIQSERRVCTMLYSRRYDPDALASWFEAQGYAVELIWPVVDSRGVKRTVHFLLRRR